MAGQLTAIQNEVSATEKAVKAAQDNAAAAADGARATRESIVLTHRPRLILRHVDVSDLENMNPVGGLKGTIWATNTGNTVAHVIKFDAVWITAKQLPRRHPYARSEATKTNVKDIAPGTSFPFSLPELVVQRDTDTYSAVHSDAGPDSPRLYLIGVVKYRDDLNNLRRTDFCRIYDSKTGRFTAVNDAEYEHVG